MKRLIKVVPKPTVTKSYIFHELWVLIFAAGTFVENSNKNECGLSSKALPIKCMLHTYIPNLLVPMAAVLTGQPYNQHTHEWQGLQRQISIPLLDHICPSLDNFFERQMIFICFNTQINLFPYFLVYM